MRRNATAAASQAAGDVGIDLPSYARKPPTGAAVLGLTSFPKEDKTSFSMNCFSGFRYGADLGTKKNGVPLAPARHFVRLILFVGHSRFNLKTTSSPQRLGMNTVSKRISCDQHALLASGATKI